MITNDVVLVTFNDLNRGGRTILWISRLIIRLGRQQRYIDKHMKVKRQQEKQEAEQIRSTL